MDEATFAEMKDKISFLEGQAFDLNAACKAKDKSNGKLSKALKQLLAACDIADGEGELSAHVDGALLDAARAAIDNPAAATIEQTEPEAESPKPPKSPIEVMLSIGAETREDLYYRMREEIGDWSREGPHDHVWGGAGTHGHVTVELRDVSPDQYRKELDDWFQNQKAAKPKTDK